MNNEFLLELNDMQKKAVEQINGEVLVLAGAGTGKTKTITYRIANMIENNEINPYNILALTFTNKASNEMKERIESLIGEKGKQCTISTFHAFGLNLLRTYYNYIGYKENISLYDIDEQEKVIEELDKRYNLLNNIEIDTGTLLEYFSNFKELELVKNPSAIDKYLENVPKKNLIVDFFKFYERYLKENNAIDFSDILYLTKKLLENNEILEIIQERFKYILIDEYQDTNQIQFKIIEKIANKYKNICVVGDENQSIYKFRGADITNILNFTNVYPNATIIKLEQNYRSTKIIIETSNSLIENNKSKTNKKLWTENEKGEFVKILQCNNSYIEAKRVFEEIKKVIKKGFNYNDIAILYRTNAQSKKFENILKNEKIPFEIYGSLSFYHKSEIKDVIYCLKLFYNTNDDIALERVLNISKNKIRNGDIVKLKSFALKNELSLFDTLKFVKEINLTNVVKKEIEKFHCLIKKNQKRIENGIGITEVLNHFLEKIHYYKFIQNNVKYGDFFEERCDNIEKFKFVIAKIENKLIGEQNKIGMLLQEILLNKFAKEENMNALKLMSIHNSKGLEFPVVFVVGMVEDVFPNYNCQTEEDFEEERRICYVALTRAKKELYLSFYTSENIYNKEKKIKPSQFLYEIPKPNIKILQNKRED